MSHLVNGRPAEAVPLLDQAIGGDPRHGMALEHLGLAHLLLGQFADAERVLRRAAALPGAPASVPMRLGVSLLRQQKHEEAVQHLQRALALDPQSADCHLNLGQALAQMGNTEEARDHLETVLRLAPNHFDAMFNLGVIALNADALAEARERFERILAFEPRYADALVGLGLILQKQQQWDEAIGFFRHALAINPRLASAGNNLAHTLLLQGKPGDARLQYLATLQIAPNLLEAREGLAAACVALGRYREGAAQLRELLRSDPENSRAWSVLADALFQSGELDEAQSAATRACTLDPASPACYSTLALVYIVRREFERAIAVLEAGFQRTGAGGLLGMLAHQLRRACDWHRWRDAWAELMHRLDREPQLGSPFWLLIEETTAEQQLSYTRRWSAATFAAENRKKHGRTPRTAHSGERVRIGYLSSEFHEHAIAYLFAGVLEAHDRSRFEIFAYSYGPEDRSPMRARLCRAAEHFIDVAAEPDDIVVRRIEDAKLDILVDLKGYTLGARTNILAQRPCAIQVNWLGYPGTMGAHFIDYLITDGFIVPPGTEALYSERILRLSHCWQCNDRSRPQIEPLARSDYGLPNDGFVFCCFTQTVKISPQVFARWINLLGRIPRSTLWLAEDNEWATLNLRNAAKAHGIAPERVVFSPRIPFAQHLARYRVADLALDTYPYTSHSTASDALWSGCPLVALCGDTFAARVSGSILEHAGLPDLITHSLEDYEELAWRLATDSSLLTRIRSRVAAARASALFDAASFTRDLENLYFRLANP